MSTKLVAIGHNIPGYLPESEPVVVHLDTDEDYTDALAIMFDDMWRDGDFNIESAEDPASDEASGDAGMFELIDTGSKYASGELWGDLRHTLVTHGEVGYRISWTLGDVSYWIMPTDETTCTDEYCDECQDYGHV